MHKISLLLVLALVLTLPAAAHAGVYETITSVPSVTDASYTVYTVTLNTDNGDYIVGWDGAITLNSGATLSQQNPFGNGTIFMDNNNLFQHDSSADLDLDSQYLFETSLKDAVDGVLVGSSSEDTTSLTAGFAMIAGRSNAHAGPVVPLAQVVLPTADGGAWASGTVVVRNAQDVPSPVQIAFQVGVPEPATLALLSLGGLAMARRRRR